MHREPEINPTHLELPGEPRILRIAVEWSDGRDEDADTVRVWVIVPDNTPDEKLIWPAVEPIESAIKKDLEKHKLDVFPVILYRTESEYREEKGR